MMAPGPGPVSSTSPPVSISSKLRRNRKARDDNEVFSTAKANGSTDDHLLSLSGARMSTESSTGKASDRLSDKLADKKHPHVRRSGEEERPSSESSRRLSRLIPDMMKRRKGSNGHGMDGDGYRPDLLSANSGGHNGSTTSFSKASSVRSSLLTEDSDMDEVRSAVKSVRSSITEYSHKGDLTTFTSPQINALARTHQPDTTPSSGSPARSESLGSTRSSGGIKEPVDADPTKSADTTGPSSGGRKSDQSIGPSSSIPQDLRLVTDGEAIKSASTASTRPQTPSGRHGAAPGRHGEVATAPETLVTPPTPTRNDPEHSPARSSASKASPVRQRPKSLAFSSITALGPAKSTTASAAGLSPTAEETNTPGGKISSPPANNFFSSVISAASNAASTWSNSLQALPGQKGKEVKLHGGEPGGGVDGEPAGAGETERHGSFKPRSATAPVRSHISAGVGAESRPMSRASVISVATAAQPYAAENNGSMRTDEASAAPAIAAAYEKPVQVAIAQAQDAGRPRSVASQSSTYLNDQSPGRPPTEAANDLHRSGSIRSRLSDRRKNRKRGSSDGTTNAVAPSLASPGSLGASNALSPRTTGFAVANVKRNKDFHQLFRSVPEDDYLIEDYSAALQRDILLHGRFYVSEGHLCFFSNILGWVTNLVIAFDEILSVEKKNTAIVFPNALVIETAHSKNTFASFVTRDSTFDLLVGIWKASHPNLLISPTSVALDRSVAPDVVQKGDSTGSDGSDDGSDDVYDEDAEGNDDLISLTGTALNESVAGSDVGEVTVTRKGLSQAVSSAVASSGSAAKTVDGPDSAVSAIAASNDFPGPASHEATECSDGATHYDRPLIDTTIAAPLGKIYSLYFGTQSGAFMKKWLVEVQKSRELAYEDDKIGLDDTHKSFTYSYIKPLNAPVGPRQTKCIVTCTLQHLDLASHVSVDCSTQTPDVPSGNIFTTRTRYCLMWAPGNSTRLVANCTIEWSGKSWLKGPIEKGANDGQTQYVKDLAAALRAAVSGNSRQGGRSGGAAGNRNGGKKSRRPTRGDGDLAAAGPSAEEQRVGEEDWGLYEPLRPGLGPIVSLLRPFFNTHTIISLLLVLLVQSWFFNSVRRQGVAVYSVDGGGGGGGAAERLGGYEALWAREEAELWDWLEERVGLDRGLLSSEDASSSSPSSPGFAADKGESAAAAAAARKSGRMGAEAKREAERMRAREIDEALSITEEKLGLLKGRQARLRQAHARAGEL